MGHSLLVYANKIAHKLRQVSPDNLDPMKRYGVLVLSSERNLKSQIRQAAAAGAKVLLIAGELEQSRGVVQLRQLNSRLPFDAPYQEMIPIENLVAEIKSRLQLG